MRNFKFALGEIVEDKVTGFVGVVTSRSEHISGCESYGVQSQKLKDGAIQDPKYFDEPRLKSQGAYIEIVDERVERTGADAVPQSTRGIPQSTR